VDLDLGIDLRLELELLVGLIGAAVLGSVIGVERERRGHPAGIRTHLLVAVGSAMFTELSIHGFPSTPGQPADPTRIAAQIVTGIGFLGAGAILKYGTSIRGLTTAASLWSAAAIGMAAGAGAWVIAIAGTAIVIVSLGPVRWLTHRIGLAERAARVRLRVDRLDRLADVTRELAAHQIELLDIETERSGAGHAIELRLSLPAGVSGQDLATRLDGFDGVDVEEVAHLGE
jgi:putative Mg2+ transporter-C (MgtC) family protein